MSSLRGSSGSRSGEGLSKDSCDSSRMHIDYTSLIGFTIVLLHCHVMFDPAMARTRTLSALRIRFISFLSLFVSLVSSGILHIRT